jgi:AmmeMemoRadiSam system protein B
MPLPERPRLHPFITIDPENSNGRAVVLCDRLGLGGGALRFSMAELQIVQLFNGNRTLHEIQAEAMRRNGGALLPFEICARLAQRLEEALFLDGPSYQAALDRPVREPWCIGCYSAEPATLRRQLRQLFTGPGGPGLPGEPGADDRLRAALLPHIDYGRGGVTYGWGFKEVYERTTASLFVIIGTSHCSAERFTLTRKHFRTPLGIVPTDQGYIDRLVAHYGDGLFDDEHQAHLPEHSIELEAVLLQYLYENQRPVRMVPLVVGSFRDCVLDGCEPTTRADIGRMVAALRAVEAEMDEPICYLISGDLAHIGPKFGDPEPVTSATVQQSRSQDQAILQQTERADPAGYFRTIAEELDRRRICGLPPTYTLLEALRPGCGKVLHYGQYVHPRGHESVSFASAGFYR